MGIESVDPWPASEYEFDEIELFRQFEVIAENPT